jgi:hypothetical protein
MRRVYAFALAAVTLAPAVSVVYAQGDVSHAVAGGGIMVPGWQGKIDRSRSMTINDDKLEKVGDALHVMTGPAVGYWNPANKASGDYTVKATFTEPHFQNLNPAHPHPYGIFIGGNDLGTDTQSYLYCAAYGDGRFIVRGFGPAAFALNGGEGETNAAVHKAAAKGEPVSQTIAMSVKGDDVTCSINGKQVAKYDKSAIVGPGKLKSTDGVYGLRFAHNVEANVTGLTVTKP